MCVCVCVCVCVYVCIYVCIDHFIRCQDIGYLTHRIGYIETTSIGASVRHRPNDIIFNDIIINDIIITVGEPSPLIAVQFDMNPLGMTADFMLFASLNPLEIIYDSVSNPSMILYMGFLHATKFL